MPLLFDHVLDGPASNKRRIYCYATMSSHASSYSSCQPVQPVSALTLLQEERKRKNKIGLLQHPSLALPIGSLTQLAGPAGAGKTQLALSLCVDCVARNQRAVYIALGGPNNTASKRLRAMVAARMVGQKTADSDTAATGTAIQALLSRIYLHWIRNSEDLMDLLEHRLYELLKRHPTISVVILDGMSNLFRIPEEHTAQNDPNLNPWQQRATTFFQLSSRCKILSSTCQVPFLILNGVTTRIRDGNHTDQQSNNLVPALGLA
jgi:hypothetical protein